VGVEETERTNIPKKFDISIYPNPTRGVAFISCKLPENTPVECAIYDITGAEIKNLSSSQKNNNSAFIWDGRDNKGNQVSPGVYFLRVKTQDTYSDAKLIVIE